MGEEDESDDLDELEDPRITEVESDEEAPKLVETKGKNKRAAEEAKPAANEPALPVPVSAKKGNSDNERRLQEIQAEQNDTAADGDNEAIVTEARLEPTLGEATDAEKTVEEVQEPFSMSHINLSISKGELVAIVGPVGSGKSSFLQACIGEMRQTGGTVRWGSERVAYCSH